MYCNLEIHDELNALGGLICPFCYTQIRTSIYGEGWSVTKLSNVVTRTEEQPRSKVRYRFSFLLPQLFHFLVEIALLGKSN